MRQNILQRYPGANVRVLVVWFDVLTGDSRGMLDARILDDHRVTNYWDSRHVAGRWFANQVSGSAGGIDWDIYFLYGPGAHWGDTPGPLVSSGGSVIGASAQLRNAVQPYLGT